MVGQALILTAVLLSAGRFGPNNMVVVEPAGGKFRITAYGDTQVVKIVAQDFELEDCQEVLKDGLHPGRCLFSEGGLILVSRDPNGTRIRFEGSGKENFVEYVTNLAGRAQAAKTLAP